MPDSAMPFELPTLPFVSGDLPPTGGEIRTEPEDFRVEEVPSYAACGEGDHLFVTVEKRLLTTEEVGRALGKATGVGPRDVSWAGQKDRDAVTVQRFSLPAAVEDQLEQFELDGARILNTERHDNRLKTGHLAANRFVIRVRGAEPDAVPRAEAIAERLRALGVPNAYGPQRFGREGNTARAGFRLLADPKKGPGARDRYRRKLNLSAAQAALYNRYLAERIADGLMHRVLEGDVAKRTDSGGMFVVEDAAEGQTRFDAREIVTAGPIFGRKTRAAAGEAAKREEALLNAAGLSAESFRPFGKLALGTRRNNLLFLPELGVEPSEDGFTVRFVLPSGSYATVILREFLRRDVR